MDNFQIETAQNVSIQQNAAGIGDRILAFMVDSLIIVLYFLFIFIMMALLDISSSDGWVFWMVFSLPILVYHLLWEIFWEGRSPGKSLLKLRVVRLDGSRPAFSNYLVRWLLRVIDISLLSGAVAVVMILITGRGQRLGDLAAGTTVISEKQQAFLKQTILVDIPEGYTPTFPQVTVFSDQEMRKIKKIHQDAKRNGDHQIIITLSKKVSAVMDVSPEHKPLDFLNIVIADYNFYTQQG